MNLKRASILVSVLFLLAACDTHTGVESIAPQEVALARVDPDAALAGKVEKALGAEGAPFAYGVEVTAQDGNVELWGTVDSTAARKRFELTAAGVVGVKSLQSHLKVDPGA
jgi:osmotically-inducible protein OsmY